VAGGWVNLPFHLGSLLGPAFEHFLEPSFELAHPAHLPSVGTQWALVVVSVAVAVAGIAFAWRRYVAKRTAIESGGVFDTLLAGYHVDDLYGRTIVAPGKALSEYFAFTTDARGIDAAVNGVGVAVKRIASRLSPFQTGFVRSYGAGILVGTAVLIIWVVAGGGGFF
jgi:NADH-quinone oxidoreductase subunit L